MAERPILFSAPMVRAILAGTKTQTRRVLKSRWPSCHVEVNDGVPEIVNTENPEARIPAPCPYGQPGDRLWVREAWGWDWYDDGQTRAWKRPVYRADPGAQPSDNGSPAPWHPSIHMPRSLSRITLEITGVRVERLRDISEADAIAEGAEPLLVPPDGGSMPHVEGYRDLWESINGPGSWARNPWVWAVSFRRLEGSA